MTVIPVSSISPSDLRTLSNNILPQVRRESRQLSAINRTLAMFDESVERLYRRRASPPAPRTRRRRAA